MKQPRYETVTLDQIVGGGQAIGTLESGKKAFVWGGLPGETVELVVTKSKSSFVEGVVSQVLRASDQRIAPLDPDSYLSTSPWQIMTFDAEQFYKSALIEEAFELHDIVLPNPIEMYTDNNTTHYRNKVEFSWYSARIVETDASDHASSDEGSAFPAEPRQERQLYQSAPSRPEAEDDGGACDTLDLAFYRRRSKGKITIDSCSLLPDSMMNLAREIRDLLHRKRISARTLKTVLIRCDQQGNCVWQLYVKDEQFDAISDDDASTLPALGGEVIYSDPCSPASRITTRLAKFGDIVLTDTILGVPFRYATEGFFQVNIPVYEQALRDMARWVGDHTSSDEGSAFPAETRQERQLYQSAPSRPEAEDGGGAGGNTTATSAIAVKRPVVDLYSGVGSIGLTIGGDNVTLVEINADAVREMRANIQSLGRADTARAVLAASEHALDYIDSDSIVIVDPPRAGLHADVIARLLETKPARIIYLSCNPVTQARDVAMLGEAYGIRHHMGYNFFPRTPHIEHLVILDNKLMI